MLTCHVAYLEALKYADTKALPSWVNYITAFTPTITEGNWSCIFMNAMFCEAMYRQNPLKAVGLMDEAGVPNGAIIDLSHQFKALPVVDTYKPIAPPTFYDMPAVWLKRGYEVELEKATEGDLVVTEQFVGWLRDANHLHLKVFHGKDFGELGETKVAANNAVILRV